MIDISKPIDVFLGEEFLKFAGVPGGYFYRNKENVPGLRSALLGARPRADIVIARNAAFSPDLFSEFQKKYAESFLPEFYMVYGFRSVDDEQFYPSEMSESDEYSGTRKPKPGDIWIHIDLYVTDEGALTRNLFSLIDETADRIGLISTYSGDLNGWHFVFFYPAVRLDNPDGHVRERFVSRLKDNWYYKDVCDHWNLTLDSELKHEAGNVYSLTMHAARRQQSLQP